MMERYGLEMTFPEYQALCVGASSASPITIERTLTDTLKLVRLIFQGRQCTFVYSKNRRRITTVINPDS